MPDVASRNARWEKSVVSLIVRIGIGVDVMLEQGVDQDEDKGREHT